jgi:hypothetical protein
MSKTRYQYRGWQLAACMAIFSIAYAGISDAGDSTGKLLACRSLDDATARLACFDREAAALATTPVARAPLPPAASPNAPTAPAPDPTQQFGLPERTLAAQEVAAGTRPAETKKIEAHVTKFAPGPDGRLIFTLDNDQVWRQLLSEGDLLINPGDAVTISRGFLGSYWLQTSNGRGCKVTRVR